MNTPTPEHHTPVNADVCIIVVTANSGTTLGECVRCALASDLGVELRVLDNASSDGAPQAVERAYSGDERVRVIYNGTNLGFGAAVNRGALLTCAPELLVLNPDCMLLPESISRLRAALRGQPDAGLVGAVVCDADGVPDPASRRRDPLLRRSLNTLTGRARHEASDASCEGVNVPGPMPTGVQAVEAVSGALMLVPRDLYADLGGFDEGYFLHCEDLDLCRRVRDAGRRVLLAGDVRVLHAKGGSSAQRPLFVSWHKHRGMWRWFRKFDPAARNPLLAAMVWCGIGLHFVVGVPRCVLRRG